MKNNNDSLCDNERKILDFIKKQISDLGYPPSVREICKAVGLKSTSSVHMYLARLTEKGAISKASLKTRALRVMDSTQGKISSDDIDTISVPLIGQVAAGTPILAEENIEEYMKLPLSIMKKSSSTDTLYMLKVKGDSMINAGIFDGDYVIVSKANDATNGEMVVALIEDSSTVKTFYKEDGKIRLQPANENYEPIILDDVKIIGKVVGLIRRF